MKNSTSGQEERPSAPPASEDALQNRSPRHLRNREEILSEARRLVLEKGADGFSMRELARRAGFGPASLYTYFSGRDEVLAVIGMEGLKQLGAYLEAVPDDLPHIERLVEYGAAYLSFAREHPERFALVFATLTVPVESWEEFCEEAWPFTILVDGFWGAVDDGALVSRRGLTPDAMAYGLWALAQGIAALKQHHLANFGGDIEEMDRAVIEHYVTGL